MQTEYNREKSAELAKGLANGLAADLARGLAEGVAKGLARLALLIIIILLEPRPLTGARFMGTCPVALPCFSGIDIDCIGSLQTGIQCYNALPFRVCPSARSTRGPNAKKCPLKNHLPLLFPAAGENFRSARAKIATESCVRLRLLSQGR